MKLIPELSFGSKMLCSPLKRLTFTEYNTFPLTAKRSTFAVASEAVAEKTSELFLRANGFAVKALFRLIAPKPLMLKEPSSPDMAEASLLLLSVTATPARPFCVPD